MSERYQAFSDFYPFYLSQHENDTCRRLHFVGVIGAMISLAAITATGSWSYLWLPVVMGYGLGWIGHFFFEKNRPATFKYPVYSFIGDFAMAKDILLGKVKL